MKKQIISALATAALVSTALIGQATAAGNASFILGPNAGTYTKNTNFNVTVVENGSNVNVVTAKLTFDPSKPQCLSVSGSAAFPNTITAACGNGTVTISRYTGMDAGGNPTTVSGSQQVGTITFKAIGTGNAAINFAAGSQIASGGTNVWNGNTAGGNYNLVAAPVATPTPVVGGGNGPKPTATNAPKATTAPKASATPGAVAGTQVSPAASASATPAATATPAADTKAVNVKAANGMNLNWLWLLLIPVVAAGAVAIRKVRQAK